MVPKQGDRVLVEDNDGNKRPGVVKKVTEHHPGDRFPAILVEWTQATWFNVDEVTLVSAVDQLGGLSQETP
jgi:hypothetical protein